MPCSPIKAKGSDLLWVNETKYLGVVLKSGKTFSCNWQMARSSYYRATNSILSVLGANPSIQVALALGRSSCFPIIMYGLAAIPLTITEKSQLSFAYNSLFAKLFRIKEVSTIEQCQFFSGFWPFHSVYEFQRYSFLRQSFGNTGYCGSDSPDYPDYLDLISIASKYQFNFDDSKAYLKFKMWKYLESSIF